MAHTRTDRMTTPPGLHAMTAQAGAVGYVYSELDAFGGERRKCAALQGAHAQTLPNGTPLYTTPPAAVPVEALEGLLDKAQFLVDGLDEEYVAWPTRVLMLRAELTKLTQLIKERSNG